jgi:glycerol-3-phosphate dehydrogenase
VSEEQVLAAAPGFSRPARGYRYFECQGDDARLTVEVARAAQGFGALLANHVRAERLLGETGVMGAGVADEITGERFEIQAAVTVNAGGVWADQIRALADGAAPVGTTRGATAVSEQRLTPSKGVHLVFAPGAVRTNVALFVPSAVGDGHFIFIVPWEDRVYAAPPTPLFRGPGQAGRRRLRSGLHPGHGGQGLSRRDRTGRGGVLGRAAAPAQRRPG